MPKFLHDLWTKIKRFFSAPAMDISEDDIIIFVLGSTGSGKSWFTKTATKPPYKSGETGEGELQANEAEVEYANSILALAGPGKSEFIKTATKSDSESIAANAQHPRTQKVRAIRCELSAKAKADLKGVQSIVFVDPPSLLTKLDDHDHDAEKEIKAWFNNIKYKPRSIGVIYIHGAQTDPTNNFKPNMKDYLQYFGRTVNAFRKPLHIRVVMSHDKDSCTIFRDRIAQRTSNLRARVDSLSTQPSTWGWQPLIHDEIFEGEHRVAWNVVHKLLEELVGRGRSDSPASSVLLSTTSALPLQ